MRYVISVSNVERREVFNWCLDNIGNVREHCLTLVTYVRSITFGLS